MSKKDKKCRCEEHDKEIESSEECTCEHDNCCCEEDCCCEDECNCDDECCCHDDCCCGEEHDMETYDMLSKRITELNDALLRSQAELLNYKKRKDEETAKIIKYAETEILEGFLPILDNFERAISMDDNNFGDETSKFLEGFRMVYKQTKTLLEKFEVREIECLDKEFDPTYAQAVVTEKDESKEPGIVLEVFQKGYMYKDRILRLAMVKVNE